MLTLVHERDKRRAARGGAGDAPAQRCKVWSLLVVPADDAGVEASGLTVVPHRPVLQLLAE